MRKLIIDLETKIKDASQKYYLGVSEISDQTFDAWVDELKNLDPNNSLLSQVGWGVKVYGTKLKHREPIRVSIPKIHSLNELDSNDGLYFASLKLDGLTVCLEYENGILKNAITRGDGIEGIDVTEKFKCGKIYTKIGPVLNFPNIFGENFTGVIRGEAIIDYESFEKIKDQYSNPRNAVSGIMNSKSFDNLEYVSFYPHPESLRKTPLNIKNKLEFTAGIGIDVLGFQSSKFDDSTFEYLRNYYISNKELYPIDGIVIEYFSKDKNDFNIKALKFKVEPKETTVLSVTWNESSKGALIPIVNFSTIELCEAQITKATGISYDYIISNGIIPGVKIKVTRANEVIPQIVEVIDPVSKEVATEYWLNNIENFDSYELNGVNLINKGSLESRMISAFANYHLRFDGFDKASEFIKGLDVETLFDIHQKIMYYRENREELYNIAIQYSNKSTVNKLMNLFLGQYQLNGFFSQFGLRGFGTENAILLDDKIESIFKGDIKIDDLNCNITCKGYLKNNDIFFLLKSFYTSFKVNNLWFYKKESESEIKDVVVITGSLPKTRSVIASRLKELGVEVSENIKDKKVSTLICDKPSSSLKYKYASENNIQIINLEEYCNKMNIDFNELIK